jgi:hypothetical protein
MTTLFDDDVVVVLTEAEWDLFQRPVHGDGGAQRLLQDLQGTQVAARRLSCSVRQLDRAYSYAYAYGSGGFEDRFRAVVAAATRTGKWSPEGMRAKARRRQSGGAFGRSKV